MVCGPAWNLGWNDRVHFTLKSGSYGFGAFNNKDQIAVSMKAAAAVRYTAEKSGVVDINIDRLANISTQSNGTFVYSVMVNGVSKWSTTVTMSNGVVKGDILVDTTPDELKGLTVEEGDFIEFTIWASSLNGDKTCWQGSGSVFWGTVNYSEITYEYAYTSSFNADKYPVNGTYPTSAWGVYQYPATTDSVTFGGVGAELVNQNSWAAGNDLIVCGPNAGDSSLTWHQRVHFSLKPAGNSFAAYNYADSIAVSPLRAAAVRYTAEKTGTVDINIDRLANVSTQSDGTFKYSVVINGVEKWSTTVTTTNGTITGNIVAGVTPNELKGIELKTGDLVEFTIWATALGGDHTTWQGSGNVFQATVKFRDAKDLPLATFNGNTNMPKFDANGNVVYSGNFYPVSFVKGDNGYDYSGEALLMDGRSPIMPTSNPLGAVSSVDLRWGGTARSLLVLEGFNVNFFKTPGQINVTGKMAGAIRYVVEETGTLDIKLSRFGNDAPKAAGLAKFEYVVCVNGEEIWRVKGADLAKEFDATTGLKFNEVVATDVNVRLGDTIDFIVEGDVGEADPWQGAGNYMWPTIAYSNVIPKATTSANVALGSNFALNVKVNLPEAALETMADFGLLVNGEKFPLIKESDTLYSAHNVLKAYVQDLESDTVTFQPYYITDEGVTIWGNKVTTNIIDVLQAYYNGEDEDVKNIAIATLNYVAEAQRYFDPLLGEDDLANAILAEDERDLSDFNVVAPSETVIITNPDGATVDFTGVSMILNNALALKFHIALPEDADIEEYALAAIDPMTLMAGLDATAGIPAGAMVNPLKYTEEDGDAVAYFGTTFENMDRMYAFLVINAEGEVVSDIVLYNPLTYATTMVGDIEVGFVCKSLIALNEAIDVYTGAIANR